MVQNKVFCIKYFNYQEIDKYKQKYRHNFSIEILRWHLLTEFSITKFISKHRKEYSHGIYRGNHNEKRRNKKRQTIQWHVSFTDDDTDGINPTVKFVRVNTDEIFLLLYTGDIMKGIKMRFNKANHMVTWHFYRQDCRRHYHQNNFVDQSVGNI